MPPLMAGVITHWVTEKCINISLLLYLQPYCLGALLLPRTKMFLPQSQFLIMLRQISWVFHYLLSHSYQKRLPIRTGHLATLKNRERLNLLMNQKKLAIWRCHPEQVYRTDKNQTKNSLLHPQQKRAYCLLLALNRKVITIRLNSLRPKRRPPLDCLRQPFS